MMSGVFIRFVAAGGLVLAAASTAGAVEPPDEVKQIFATRAVGAMATGA